MTDSDFLPLLGVLREGVARNVRQIVEEIQREFEIELPESLVKLWSISEDKAIVYCENAYCHSDEGYQLYSLEPSDDDFVVSRIKSFADADQQIIPIGNTAAGDRLCLSYRIGTTPTVIYYSTGNCDDLPKAIRFLARSFDEFVLRASSDFDAALDSKIGPSEIAEILGLDHHP